MKMWGTEIIAPRWLSRRAAARNRPPALDVDEGLAAARTQAAACRPGSDAYAAADRDSVRSVLPFLHQAGDLDHRAFVGLDLRHRLLRPVHAQLHAFGNVEVAAGLVCRPRADREDIAFGASGNRHAGRILRHGLVLLREQRAGQHGDRDSRDDARPYEELHAINVAPFWFRQAARDA